MTAHTVIVTSGMGALGARAAELLASHPETRVIVTSKDQAKAQQWAESVNTLYGREAVEGRELDRSSLSSVQAFVEEFAREKRVCDALLTTSAIPVRGDHHTEDLWEKSFTINHVANFVLTNLMIPYWAQNARIVTVVSSAHDPAQRTSRITGMPEPVWQPVEEMAHPLTESSLFARDVVERSRRRYTTSALCGLVWARDYASRLSERDPSLFVYAFDPGLVLGVSPVLTRSRWAKCAWTCALPWIFPFSREVRTPTMSAKNLVHLVTSWENVESSGAYIVGKKRKAPSLSARDRDKGIALWDETMAFLTHYVPETAARLTT